MAARPPHPSRRLSAAVVSAVVSAVVAVVVLAGCGAGTEVASPSSPPSSASSPSSGPSDGSSPVARVRLDVSGGLAGVSSSTTVRAGDGPARALALAASPEVRAWGGRHVTPGLADAFTYRLRVAYADGSVVTAVLDDGSLADAPAEVADLVALLREPPAS